MLKLSDSEFKLLGMSGQDLPMSYFLWSTPPVEGSPAVRCSIHPEGCVDWHVYDDGGRWMCFHPQSIEDVQAVIRLFTKPQEQK